MRWFDQIVFRLKSLFQKRQLDEQLSEEIRVHVEMATEANLAKGMSPEEARYAALREFGGVEQIKERARDERSFEWLVNLGQSIRFTVRSLRRAPGFTFAVIVTFALCIGPNTAILSVLYAEVLKPLPFADPKRLVQVYNVFETLGPTASRQQSSVPQYQDLKQNADLFEAFAITQPINATVGGSETPELVVGLRVSESFFPLLGVHAILGRFPTTDEQVKGSDHVLVLTESYWERSFNTDLNVVGRTVRLDGEPWTVIGVAPRSLEVFDAQIRFFKPFELTEAEQNSETRYTGKTTLLGRLKPDVSMDAALAQITAIDERFVAEQAPAPMHAFLERTGHHVIMRRVHEEMSEPLKAPLWFLQGGALFVLLIGCANIVNLLLARTNAKRGEFAIRYAIGASRVALLRQLLWESVGLIGFATLVGWALATGALRGINLYLPLIIPTAAPVSIDWTIFGAVLAASTVLALLMGGLSFGLILRGGLRLQDSRLVTPSRTVRFSSNLLVVLQVAFALMLLVGAGLLFRSFLRVMEIPPGFDASQIVEGRVTLSKAYREPEKNVAVQQRILGAMKEIPGVERTAIATTMAVAPSFHVSPFVLGREQETPGTYRPLVLVNMVSPDFFATLGIPLMAGRTFDDGDDNNRAAPVVMVDALFAERYFPGQDPIGQELQIGAHAPPKGQPWPRIAGVVARANLNGLEASQGLPFVFLPRIRKPAASFSLLLRTNRPAADVVSEMRRKLRGIDPDVALSATGSLQSALDGMLTRRRGLMLLLLAFAGLALLLAAVGLYGVLLYDVTQRTREIGIRGAVGATRSQILALIMRQGLGKAGAGLLIGLGGAFGLSRYMNSLLFGVKPVDLPVFAGVTLFLLAIAMLASWLPALKAAKINPMAALRCE